MNMLPTHVTNQLEIIEASYDSNHAVVTPSVTHLNSASHPSIADTGVSVFGGVSIATGTTNHRRSTHLSNLNSADVVSHSRSPMRINHSKVVKSIYVSNTSNTSNPFTDRLLEETDRYTDSTLSDDGESCEEIRRAADYSLSPEEVVDIDDIRAVALEFSVLDRKITLKTISGLIYLLPEEQNLTVLFFTDRENRSRYSADILHFVQKNAAIQLQLWYRSVLAAKVTIINMMIAEKEEYQNNNLLISVDNSVLKYKFLLKEFHRWNELHQMPMNGSQSPSPMRNKPVSFIKSNRYRSFFSVFYILSKSALVNRFMMRKELLIARSKFMRLIIDDMVEEALTRCLRTANAARSMLDINITMAVKAMDNRSSGGSGGYRISTENASSLMSSKLSPLGSHGNYAFHDDSTSSTRSVSPTPSSRDKKTLSSRFMKTFSYKNLGWENTKSASPSSREKRSEYYNEPEEILRYSNVNGDNREAPCVGDRATNTTSPMRLRNPTESIDQEDYDEENEEEEATV